MAANRAAGAEARTISAQSGGLESKKTSGHGEVFFLDFPLYRTYRESAAWSDEKIGGCFVVELANLLRYGTSSVVVEKVLPPRTSNSEVFTGMRESLAIQTVSLYEPPSAEVNSTL